MSELLTLREACKARTRYVRREAWGNSYYLEIPLLEVGGIGCWFTLHCRHAAEIPGLEALAEQNLLWTTFDFNERGWLSCNPEEMAQ